MDHFNINITPMIAHLREAHRDHSLRNSYTPQRVNKRRAIILAVIYLNLNVSVFLNCSAVKWHLEFERSDSFVHAVLLISTHPSAVRGRHSMSNHLYWESHWCFRRATRAGRGWKCWYSYLSSCYKTLRLTFTTPTQDRFSQKTKQKALLKVKLCLNHIFYSQI